MATLCSSSSIHCITVVITLVFFHLGYLTRTAAAANINGGFSARVMHIQKKDNAARRLSSEESLEVAADFDISAGYAHTMKFSMGTPPVKIALHVDTGSDIIWTQCAPCDKCFKSKYGVFDPSQSSTYSENTCQSSICDLLVELQRGPGADEACKKAPNSSCVYVSQYVDKTFSVGRLANETITVESNSGQDVTLEDIIFGCGTHNELKSGDYMGMVGFGRGPLSFVSQVAPHVGGKRFSHCFVTVTNPDAQSKIYFGNASQVTGEDVVTTSLEDHKNVYLVTITGMSIGNEFVPFNKTVGKGNAMVDTGTTYPALPRYIFDGVLTTFQKQVTSKAFLMKQQEMENLCFHASTYLKLPKISLHFAGGGELVLKEDTLLMQSSRPDVFCLAMMVSPTDRFMFGSTLMFDMLIGYDMEENVMSFKPTDCADYNKNH